MTRGSWFWLGVALGICLGSGIVWLVMLALTVLLGLTIAWGHRVSKESARW